MDTATGLTILGTAFGSAKVIERMLGPTADYIGENVKALTQRGVQNVARIFGNAQEKLGSKLNEPGAVPPKVLKGILSEGMWAEDELQVNYFGGILASSRSGVSRDDRGAYFTGIVTRLTTYQLRAHYLFYQCFKDQADKVAHINLCMNDDMDKMRVFVPYGTFLAGMDFTEAEEDSSILPHVMAGLISEGLIRKYHYGSKELLQGVLTGHKITNPLDTVPNNGGITFIPTLLGIQLFMWSYGRGLSPWQEFYRDGTNFKHVDGIRIEESGVILFY